MDQELKKLLEENLVYNKEIYKYTKSTRRILMFDQIMSAVKILIIVVPLIFGFLYLAPYFKKITETYSQLLGGSEGMKNINIEKLLR